MSNKKPFTKEGFRSIKVKSSPLSADVFVERMEGGDGLTYGIKLFFGDEVEIEFERVLDHHALFGELTMRPDHLMQVAAEEPDNQMGAIMAYVIAQHAQLSIEKDGGLCLVTLTAPIFRLTFTADFKIDEMDESLRSKLVGTPARV